MTKVKWSGRTAASFRYGIAAAPGEVRMEVDGLLAARIRAADAVRGSAGLAEVAIGGLDCSCRVWARDDTGRLGDASGEFEGLRLHLSAEHAWVRAENRRVRECAFVSHRMPVAELLAAIAELGATPDLVAGALEGAFEAEAEDGG